MTILLHLAYGLTLVSYLVKDILWLRVLACVATVTFLCVLFFRPDPQWPSIGWNSVFLVINLAQIWVLVLERRPVRLRDDEQRLYQQVFRTLRPREFVKLLALGRWEERAEGEVIVRRGEALDRVMVICDGRAAVKKDGKTIVELGEGRFVGEMSFLTGHAPAADVACAAKTKLVAWPAATLKT